MFDNLLAQGATVLLLAVAAEALSASGQRIVLCLSAAVGVVAFVALRAPDPWVGPALLVLALPVAALLTWVTRTLSAGTVLASTLIVQVLAWYLFADEASPLTGQGAGIPTLQGWSLEHTRAYALRSAVVALLTAGAALWLLRRTNALREHTAVVADLRLAWSMGIHPAWSFSVVTAVVAAATAAAAFVLVRQEPTLYGRTFSLDLAFLPVIYPLVLTSIERSLSVRASFGVLVGLGIAYVAFLNGARQVTGGEAGAADDVLVGLALILLTQTTYGWKPDHR